MTAVRIQRSFAAGKEKYAEVNVDEPYLTGIVDPDWPYTVAPGMRNLSMVEDAHLKGRLSGFTRNKDEDKNQYARKVPLGIEELKKLPINRIVGCYVFLWTVGPFLINGSASSILSAWGFEPVSILSWAKYDLAGRHGYGGVGFWFLGNSEYCIIGKRKGMPSIRTGKSSLVVARKQRHSMKPEDIHKICESRFPGPYIEIFGRRSREGWTVLGDEAPGDGKDIHLSLQDIISASSTTVSAISS